MSRTSIFEAETLVFSRAFATTRRSKRTTSDINKTLAGVVRNAHRSFRATSRKRSKIDPQVLPTAFGDANGSHECLENPPGAFWSVLGAPGASQGRSWRPRGRPKNAPGASRTRFFASLGRSNSISERPRSDSDRPKPPKIDFVSIFARFGPILHQFVGDCWSISRRNCRLFVRLFVCLFVSSFVRLRIRSFMRLFVRMFVHSFVHLRLRSHDPSFERSIYVAYIQSPPSI